MSESEEVVCPWCQTEIVWDPEIGPEDECPHCFNELKDYRSIQLTVKQTGQPLRFDEDAEEEDEEDFSAVWEDSDEPLDRYGEVVQRISDEQEEAPECPGCHEFMLLAGKETVPEQAFSPHISKTLGKAFINGPILLDVYVCPSCFKVEKLLSDSERMIMVNTMKEDV